MNAGDDGTASACLLFAPPTVLPTAAWAEASHETHAIADAGPQKFVRASLRLRACRFSTMEAAACFS